MSVGREPVRNVVVLGGGTSGWMTAAYLAKALGRTVSITVLDAPSIPRIGVGEATVPNLQRVVFDHLGIAEDQWMRECEASFKMAVKFINWRTPGAGVACARDHDGRPDHFYHPFGLLPAEDQIPMSHYWAYRRLRGETDEAYDYACFVEPPLMDAALAPRFLDGGRATTYAWHFDAQLVADYLRRFATRELSVVHVEDEMVDASLDERGFITALRTKSGRTLEGDLFVDCSGFRGALINRVMGEPFIDMSDFLLCDSAVACPLPYPDPETPIEPYTSAIAMPAGWAWKTPLLSRFGTGYVYSSKFATQDDAILDFSRLWGIDPTRSFNRIRFRVGRNRSSWVRNCVSIGLSSCFLEPLESTGIYFAYAAMYQLVKHFPDMTFDPRLIARFNREIGDMFDETRDFLQAHFYFSPRRDTPFWRANAELTLAPEIREKAAMYRAGLPINAPSTDEGNYYGNFEAELRNFWTNGSYYCIFSGLGVLPDHPLPVLTHKPEAVRASEAMFTSMRRRQQDLHCRLPPHGDYLRGMHARDSQAVPTEH